MLRLTKEFLFPTAILRLIFIVRPLVTFEWCLVRVQDANLATATLTPILHSVAPATDDTVKTLDKQKECRWRLGKGDRDRDVDEVEIMTVAVESNDNNGEDYSEIEQIWSYVI